MIIEKGGREGGEQENRSEQEGKKRREGERKEEREEGFEGDQDMQSSKKKIRGEEACC